MAEKFKSVKLFHRDGRVVIVDNARDAVKARFDGFTERKNLSPEEKAEAKAAAEAQAAQIAADEAVAAEKAAADEKAAQEAADAQAAAEAQAAGGSAQ